MKSIKLSEYFQIKSTKDQLNYYKIIPHQNTRNYKSIEIAKIINRCYKSIVKQFGKQYKGFIYEAPTKVSYYIYISKDDGVEFYLIIPKIYANLFLEKISYTWNKVEVQQVNDIPRFNDSVSKVSMEYSRSDALSLDIIDKKSNELLEAQLNVIDMMQEGDKLGIFYNFNYRSSYQQLGFKTKYNECMEKIKDGKSVEKVKMDSKSILKLVLRILVATGEELMGGISELLGEKKKNANDMDYMKKTLGILQKKDLSKHTKEKAQLEIIDTQILLLSESKSISNEKANIMSLAQSFSRMDGDNTLRPKGISKKTKINLDAYKLPISKNAMSVEEVGNLITQAGKDIILKHNIRANSINEEEVPESSKNGYIRVGKATKKGKSQEAFLNNNPDQDTGLVITGKQGSGKTEELKNYAYDCIKHGDSLVVLDFIGNNDLASTIQQIVPPHLLVELDLSKVECMESIAYPEKYYTDNMDLMSKLDIISEKTQLKVQLLNSFSYGQELTSAMRRFFISACNVTYCVNQYASFKDIIDCLELYNTRMNLITKIPEEFKDFCESHVNNLLKLNDKYTKGEDKGKDNGETCESKIERILDRISVMRESPRLEYMLSKDPKGNINFEECFDEGKVIVIKMRQDKFGTEHIRNMLSMFFTTRVWEACVNRYSKSNGEELRRVHFMIDEPHQVPKVTQYLSPLLPQMRKFRLKPVFATQSLLQLENILDDMKSAGFSYMLLAGSDKVNYKILSEELKPYEVDDLLNLERFHSLNLIPDSKGILRPFVTKLPFKLTTTPLYLENNENINNQSKIITFPNKNIS